MTRFLIILLLLGHVSIGQTIEGASINDSPNLSFNRRINLIPIYESAAKVEFRLYRHHALSNTNRLFRIFLVNRSWKGVEYDEWNNPIAIRKYKLTANPSFDSLVMKLFSYNILTLPNQSELKSKMRNDVQVAADGDTTDRKIHVIDGESYTIEVKVRDKFRVYQFSNPESYSSFYENVSELKDYLRIVQTFEKLLLRSDNR